MIKNEEQYQITKSKIETFKEAIKQLKKQLVDFDVTHWVNPKLIKVQIEALQSQLEELETQILQYEKSPSIKCIDCIYKHYSECRFNPPTTVTNKIIGWIGAEYRSELIHKSSWPIVKDDDWCYQFKQKI